MQQGIDAVESKLGKVEKKTLKEFGIEPKKIYYNKDDKYGQINIIFEW